MPIAPYLATVIPALAADIVKEKKLTGPKILAAFFFGALLFGLASWNSEVGTAFGWVAAATSLIINGDILFRAISRSV